MFVQMVVLVLFALIAFVLAACIGLANPSSSKWKYIDPLYYPIAALGVVLLFLLNSGQRRGLELVQEQARIQQERDALASRKPNVNVSLNNRMLDSGFSMISLDQQLAQSCSQAATFSPSCVVAEELAPAYADFLKLRNSTAGSDVERVAAFCVAGQTMLKQISSKGEMSELVSSELLNQYGRMLQEQYSPYNIEAIEKGAKDFQARTLSKIDALAIAMKDDDSPSMKFVFDRYRSEADVGVTIIEALGPCVSAPHKDIDAFLSWSDRSLKAEQRVMTIKEEADLVKKNDSGYSLPRWINLYLWPYLLVAASSLKFSKAMSQLRKEKPVIAGRSNQLKGFASGSDSAADANVSDGEFSARNETAKGETKPRTESSADHTESR